MINNTKSGNNHLISKTILVDLDMVITDFDGGFQRVWKQKYPDREIILLKNRKDFYLTNDYDKAFYNDIEEVINAENFLLNLDPLPGAVEGFKQLCELYVNVRICTTSLKHKFSSSEKWEWVDNNFGRKATLDMIICNDKTLVRADYLIDDRPMIKGLKTPEWKHILFTQPYNKHVSGTHFKWGEELKY